MDDLTNRVRELVAQHTAGEITRAELVRRISALIKAHKKGKKK